MNYLLRRYFLERLFDTVPCTIAIPLSSLKNAIAGACIANDPSNGLLLICTVWPIDEPV